MAARERQASEALDDRSQERESPVRRAHAEVARSHGRAGAPGYLGVPTDELEREQAATEKREAREEEDKGGGREASKQDQGRPERGPRARARSSAKETEAQRGDADDGAQQAGGRGRRASSRRSRGTRSRSAATSSSPSRSRDGSKSSKRASAAPKKQKAAAAKKQKSTKASRASGAKPAKAASPSKASKAKPPKRGTPSKASRSPSKASGSPKRSQTSAARKGRSAAKRAVAAAAPLKSKVASAAQGAEESLRGAKGSPGRHLAGRLARRLARRMLRKGTRAATHLVARAGSAGFDAIASRAHRLPIQRAVDVAVPLEVAWEQWMELKHVPEGSHRVADVERQGDLLRGHLEGATSRDWEAEIVDERDSESFAWRSVEGSDSAGLVTFHALGDRLTRIELNLDIRPVDPLEAAALALRVADRRAESELRRFKADAELLNPDIYDELLSSQNGAGGSE